MTPERNEVLRLESSSAGKFVVPVGVSEAVLSVKPDSPPVHLVLGASFRNLQLTGNSSLQELTIEGAGNILLTAASHKEIGLLRVRSRRVSFSEVSPSRIELLEGDAGGSSSVWIADGRVVDELVAKGGLTVAALRPNRILLASPGDESAPLVGTVADTLNLRVGRLETDAVSLEGNLTLEVNNWVAASGVGATLLVDGVEPTLRLANRTPDEGLSVMCPDGEMQVVGATLRKLTGQIRRLSTSGPAVVHGEGVRVTELRCDVGAKIAGLAVGALDLASLDYVANATSFDVQVPERWRFSSFLHDGAADHWARDPGAWRALYAELETKGNPRSARWARIMERGARRTVSPRFSVERAVLEVARLLGYGESVVRPLSVHAFVCAAILLSFTVPSPLPSADVSEPWWPLLVQLFLSPLWLFNSDLFGPTSGSAEVLVVAWFVCAFIGSTCFATAALAVRRILAYGQSG